jgi:hypothetical protein
MHGGIIASKPVSECSASSSETVCSEDDGFSKAVAKQKKKDILVPSAIIEEAASINPFKVGVLAAFHIRHSVNSLLVGSDC